MFVRLLDAIPSRFKGTSAAVKAGSSCFGGPMEAGMSRKSSVFFSERVTHTIGLESRLFFKTPDRFLLLYLLAGPSVGMGWREWRGCQVMKS